MIQITPYRQLLNFRQWSRKGFAVFASLGKEVRIAVLKFAVSEFLSRKDYKLTKIISQILKAEDVHDEFDCDNMELCFELIEMSCFASESSISDDCNVVKYYKCIGTLLI